eukprot:m.270110 g.270110  ORF g.270110 m.270110 type:complete len:107 (+) comp16262_c0_seq7:3855-4175(+)
MTYVFYLTGSIPVGEGEVAPLILCSDENVVCEIFAEELTKQPYVALKAPVQTGEYSFFVAFFEDKRSSVATEIWQIHIHAREVIDVSANVGEVVCLGSHIGVLFEL